MFQEETHDEDRRTLVASGAALALTPAIPHAQKKYDPGVSDKEIKLGQKDSGANVFFNDGAPKAAAQAIRKVADHSAATTSPART